MFVEQAKANTQMFQFLEPIYLEVVKPMEEALKRLAIKTKICSESEMFASGLKFKIFLLQNQLAGKNQVRAEKKDKSQDVKKQLKNGLQLAVSEYKSKFSQIYKKAKRIHIPRKDLCPKLERELAKDKLKRDLACCTYFASYLSLGNSATLAFVSSVASPELAEHFTRLEQEEFELKPKWQKRKSKLRQNYGFYLNHCYKAETYHGYCLP